MEHNRVAILIPAFNEEHTIETVLKILPKGISTYVIDDASTDKTAVIARKNQVIVLQNSSNQGYEKSLLFGFKYIMANSNCDAIVILDADGEHDPEYVLEMLRYYNQGSDIVSGIRHRFNRISEIHTAHVFNLLYGLRDPLCGMRVYSTRFLQDYLENNQRLYLGILPLKFALKREYSLKQVEMSVGKRKDQSRFGSKFKSNIKIYVISLMCLFYYVRPLKLFDK